MLGRYFQATAALTRMLSWYGSQATTSARTAILSTAWLLRFVSSGWEYMATDSRRLPYGWEPRCSSLVRFAERITPLRVRPIVNTSAHGWRGTAGLEVSPEILESDDYGRLRCTIDDEEDYQRIVALFRGVASRYLLVGLTSVRKLASFPDALEAFRVPYRVAVGGRIQSELTLARQLLYGLWHCQSKWQNRREPDSIGMVRHAIAHGVTHLDTARTYGDRKIPGEALQGAAIAGRGHHETGYAGIVAATRIRRRCEPR
jgi:hypothetical protein